MDWLGIRGENKHFFLTTDLENHGFYQFSIVDEFIVHR